MKRVLVTGAGGFIGHHLVSYLKRTATGYEAWMLRTRSTTIQMPMSSFC